MISNDRPASGATEDHGPVVHELVVEGAAEQGAWDIHLHEEVMRLSKDSELFVYRRAEIAEKAKITIFGDRGVLVFEGGPSGLRLDREATQVLRGWMGPHLAAWGKKSASRLAMSTIFSGVFMLGLWWLVGGWFLLALGAISLMTGLGRLLAPGRWVNAADVGRSLLITVVLVTEIALGGIAWWWGFFLLLVPFSALASVHAFRFFAPIAPDSKQQ